MKFACVFVLLNEKSDRLHLSHSLLKSKANDIVGNQAEEELRVNLTNNFDAPVFASARYNIFYDPRFEPGTILSIAMVLKLMELSAVAFLLD